MINLGENLKYQREIHGLNQSQLARKTGIKQQNISAWESNTFTPNIEFCIILADFYGISIDELIGRDFTEQQTKKITVDNSFNESNITGGIKFWWRYF